MTVKLSLRDVRKRFGDLEVCKGIDLDIAEGEMVCLIGASGSGKSTLLRCMNLLEPIDDGEIFLDGDDISEPGLDPQSVRQQIGMVFQSYNLFPHMTAIENVMLAPRRVKRLTRDALRPEVSELFTRFGLADRMEHYPDQLSGGQQQRVAIIRALAMKPQIMLFDEITSALDPELVGEVLKVMQDLAQEGRTMVVVTHEMGFAREVSNQLVFLHKGIVEERGNPREVLVNPQSERLQQFLSGSLK